jgi:glutamine amidotransferase
MSRLRTAVVDAGTGNLRSVLRALARAGVDATLTQDPDALREADRVVVPGQGSFGTFAAGLEGGLGEALLEHLAADRPYLGICLGLQILLEGSDEAPGVPGLGVIEGRVMRFPDGRRDEAGRLLKVPHMGWSEVHSADPLLADWFYFVHSFYADPADRSLVVGEAHYGGPFCAVLRRGAALACQFHPEKSQRAGARLLESLMKEQKWS